MTRDRVLTYAIAVSLVTHLCAVVVIGRTSAARLSAAPPSLAPRYINVDLVDLPAKQAPSPDQAPKVSLPKPPPAPRPDHSAPPPDHGAYAAPTHHMGPPRPGHTAQPPGDPGGKLNIGSTSPGGDLPGDWDGGKTPTGWVPDPSDGPGKGSGTGPGVGTPDPPKHADPGPNTRPEPNPLPPAMVSVRICSDSGLLAGPNCKGTKTDSFIEGKQPSRTCDKCRPPHTSRLADRAEPQLIRDSRLAVPGSVPEGMTLRVEVQYTVTADGDVTGVEIVKSSGNKALDRAVTRAASEMKYKPAVQDGVPRSVKKTRSYTINT